MFLTLDLLFSFHMFHAIFIQSSPHPKDPLPLLHHSQIPLCKLWQYSCYSFYISKVLCCMYFYPLPLPDLSGPLTSLLNP
jgi:hypothetical protein